MLWRTCITVVAGTYRLWNKSGFLGSLPPVLEAQEEGARACFLGTCVRLPTLPPKTPTDKSPLPTAKNSSSLLLPPHWDSQSSLGLAGSIYRSVSMTMTMTVNHPPASQEPWEPVPYHQG